MYRLRTLVFSVLFVASFNFLTVTTEIPPLPSRDPIENLVWINYSMRIVRELFPTRPHLAKKAVLIREDGVPFAINEPIGITISTGFIQEVRNEKEYSALLSHELGHVLLGHDSVRNALPSKKEMANPYLLELAINEIKVWRREEAEADFVNVVSTGDLRSSYDLLYRDIKRNAGESRSPVGRELKRLEGYRLQVLRNMMTIPGFAPIVPAHSLPLPLPDWNAELKVWVDYLRRLLHAMYPNYTNLVDDVILVPIFGGSTALVEYFGERNEKSVISFNLERLQKVIKSPEEMAVLAGHEFGHVITKRDYPFDYLNTDISYTQDEIMARVQFEADIIGTLPIPRGDCIFAEVLWRMVLLDLIDSWPRELDFRNDYKRINLLRKMCTNK